MEKHYVLCEKRELCPCLKQILDKLFHLVKALDVCLFKGSRLLASVPHYQENESVTGHVVTRLLMSLSVEVSRLIKIDESELIGTIKVPNVTDYVCVKLAKHLSHHKAVRSHNTVGICIDTKFVFCYKVFLHDFFLSACDLRSGYKKEPVAIHRPHKP